MYRHISLVRLILYYWIRIKHFFHERYEIFTLKETIFGHKIRLEGPKQKKASPLKWQTFRQVASQSGLIASHK